MLRHRTRVPLGLIRNIGFLLQWYGFTVAWPVWWGSSAGRRCVRGLLPVLDQWRERAWSGGVDANLDIQSALKIGPNVQCVRPVSRPGELGLLLRSEEHTSELQSLRHLVC